MSGIWWIDRSLEMSGAACVHQETRAHKRLCDEGMRLSTTGWRHMLIPNICFALPPPQVGKMRAALKEVWPRLLWTTLYNKAHGPYLGEDGSRDAFHTIMQILAARVPHGFRPAPAIAARFKHAGYPCRKRDEASASEAKWGRA